MVARPSIKYEHDTKRQEDCLHTSMQQLEKGLANLEVTPDFRTLHVIPSTAKTPGFAFATPGSGSGSVGGADAGAGASTRASLVQTGTPLPSKPKRSGDDLTSFNVDAKTGEYIHIPSSVPEAETWRQWATPAASASSAAFASAAASGFSFKIPAEQGFTVGSIGRTTVGSTGRKQAASAVGRKQTVSGRKQTVSAASNFLQSETAVHKVADVPHVDYSDSESDSDL